MIAFINILGTPEQADEPFFFFLKVLFFHLVGHKWFKSFFLSLFICLLVQFRQSIFDFFIDKPLFFWIILFTVVYEFEIMKALLTAKEYVGETRHNILRADFPQPLILSVNTSEDSGRIVVYSYDWKFQKKMRVSPALYFNNSTFLLTEFIEHVLSIWLVSSELASFELKLHYKNPINLNDREPDTYIGDFDVIADSNLFQKDDIRSKVLIFFSKTWSNSKWGWFC